MTSRIPKIIHFIYHPDKISAAERTYIEKARALHPDWEIKEWVEPYDPKDFPLSHQWKHCATGAQLADLVRVDVVAKDGGIYADVDMEMVSRLDGLLDHEFFVGTEDGWVLTNAIFGSVPGGAAIMKLQQELSRLRPADMAKRADLSTGPSLWARVLRFRTDITVLPRNVFYPYSWHEPAAPFMTDVTLAIHRWHGSWMEDKPIKNRLLYELRRQPKRLAKKLKKAGLQKVRSALHKLKRPQDQFAAYVASENPVVVNTIHGHYIHAAGDDLSITPYLATKGYYELGEERFILNWLRGGDWMADVGANIGVMTTVAGSRVGPMGRVLAFEPSPRTRANLDKTILLNWFHDRVRVYPSAVGETPGRATLTFSNQFLGSGSLVADRGSEQHAFLEEMHLNDTVEVDVVRLDDLLPAPMHLRLLKIDVEGFEAFVLRGAKALLSSGRIDAVMLEASPEIAADQWEGLLSEMHALIAMGYRLHFVNNDGRAKLDELTTIAFDQGRNCLFIHKNALWPDELWPRKQAAKAA